jgi:hypothetical protein
MQMNIQIGRGAKALDERDRAGAGSAKFEARPLDQKAGNDPVDHLQERREQLRLSGAVAQAEKPVRETASCEEGIELAFYKLRQTAATLGFDLRQEAFEVLLN